MTGGQQPVFESVELTSYESYELAEINHDRDRAQRALQNADGRMNQLAWKVLKDSGKDGASLEGWDFHIEQESKRVLLRREEVKPVPGSLGDVLSKTEGRVLKPGERCDEPAKWLCGGEYVCDAHLGYYSGEHQPANASEQSLGCGYVEPEPPPKPDPDPPEHRSN